MAGPREPAVIAKATKEVTPWGGHDRVKGASRSVSDRGDLCQGRQGGGRGRKEGRKEAGRKGGKSHSLPTSTALSAIVHRRIWKHLEGGEGDTGCLPIPVMKFLALGLARLPEDTRCRWQGSQKLNFNVDTVEGESIW